LPTDFNFSPKNASTGTNDNNSDVNSTTGKTDVLTLNAGDNLTNVDAGMFYNPPPPVYASIGDFVWDDTNKDGIQDANELGIKDVVVKLLDAANSDAVLKTTTTDTQQAIIKYPLPYLLILILVRRMQVLLQTALILM